MSRKFNAKDTISVPFKAVVTAALSSGVASLPLTGGMTGRLAAIADSYDEFRFTKLSFRIRHPAAMTSPGYQIAGYAAGITDTAPTLPTIGEYLTSCLITSWESTYQPYAKVPAGVLAGMHPWYKTIAGSPEPSEEVQGTIYIAGTGTDVYFLEVAGEIQFRCSAPTGSTPLDRALAMRKREKARLLTLLALADNTPPK